MSSMLQRVVWGEEILRAGRVLRRSTCGSSMRPLIRDDDVIVVKPAGAAEVSAGDVVVYRSGGTLVAHRLIRKHGSNGSTMLITKGDSKSVCDAPLPESELLGRVVEVERDGRRTDLDNTVQRALGLFCARAVPHIIWMLPALGKAKRALRKVLGG